MIQGKKPRLLCLESYDQFCAAQVGGSIMLHVSNWGQRFKLQNVYLKYEGGNPTGTHKDRIAFTLVRQALKERNPAITAGTCGNYGVALSYAALLAGIRCIVYVPEKYQGTRIDEIVDNGAEVIRVPGTYEDAVRHSQQRADSDGLLDANAGGPHTDLQLKMYAKIAYEICNDLQRVPRIIGVPVSNGTLLAGVYRGFQDLYRSGKIHRIPKLVAGSCTGGNPIIHACENNLVSCEDLDPRNIRETPVNEPLVNWHSSDGEFALKAVRATGGWASYISDELMVSVSRQILEKEGLSTLPAAVAGLAALLKRHCKDLLPPDCYVAIVTARNKFSSAVGRRVQRHI